MAKLIKSLALTVCLGLGFANAPGAQTVQATGGILTVEPERLYAESQYGQRIELDLESARKVLIAENRALESALSAEEESLVEQRKDLSPEEFKVIADAFDEKVQSIRQTQETKTRALTNRRETERQTFLNFAFPIVAEISRERGAVAVLERRAVLLAAESIDITDETILRIDAELGDGKNRPSGGENEVAPVPAPQ